MCTASLLFHLDITHLLPAARAVLSCTQGILVGVSASFLSLVTQTYSPIVLVLGRFPGTDVYRDVKRYNVVSEPPPEHLNLPDDILSAHLTDFFFFFFFKYLLFMPRWWYLPPCCMLVGKGRTWHSLHAFW